MMSLTLTFTVVFLWSILGLSWSQQVHHLVVSSFADGAPNAADCLPAAAANGQCNLRSAWEACTALPTTDSCSIHLPPGANISLADGPLVLMPGQNVQVSGNNATVQQANPFSENLVNEISVDLENIDSALLNMVEHCVDACPGDAFRFTGCDGDTGQDTVFRLFLNGKEVAFNDDACVIASEIVYMYDGDACTSNLCLRAACAYENGGCIVSLNTYRGVVPETSLRFVEYFANNSAEAGTVPKLSVSNLTVAAFGNPFANGGAIHLGGPVEVVMDSVTFRKNIGRYGAALWLAENTVGVSLSQCQFVDCNSNKGGAMSVFEDSSNVEIYNSSFIGCHAREGGGGLHIGNNNSNIDVRDTSFIACTTAGSGGGVQLVSENRKFRLSNSLFVGCQALNGGGLSAGTHNIDMAIDNTLVENCFASGVGGGFHFAIRNAVSVAKAVFTDCTTYNGGGGVYLQQDNPNCVFEDVVFKRCQGGDGNGGGMYIGINNSYAQISRASFENCYAVGGGGVYLDNKNEHVRIETSTFQACSGRDDGGAVYSQGSRDLQLHRVEFTASVAEDFSGGALYLGVRNEGVTLSECTFLHNTAVDSGGAIFSSITTNNVTIAGCWLEGNVAGDGGALAVEGGNSNLVITDSTSAAKSLVLESAHPYEKVSDNVIFSHLVNDTTVAGFILQFDPKTEIGTEDIVFISSPADNFTDAVPQLFWRRDDALPGIHAPSQRVPAAFTVFLYSPTTDDAPAVVLSDNLYGFKLYLTPIPIQAAVPTTFTNNRAEDRGGAIYMSSAVEFATILSTDFKSNTAGAGGAVYLRNAMTGFTAQSCVFTENSASGDGGALVVSSATFGLQLQQCEFRNNSAAVSGGAVSFVNNNGKDGRFYGDEENMLVLRDCLLAGNAADYGGAIHADKDNELKVQDCKLRDNTARVGGGAVLANERNVVYLSNSTVYNNIAGEMGGGVAALVRNTITVDSMLLSNNTAGTIGGGAYFANSTDPSFTGVVTMTGNAAGQAGGAVGSCFAVPLWGAEADPAYGTEDAVLFLTDNAARRGSALFMRSVVLKESTSDLLRGHVIEGNEASVGGTVYWMYDGTMSEDPFLPVNDSSAVWGSNTAPYGETFATQAVQVLGPQEYTATVYGAALSPPLSFALFDFYGQEIPINGPAHVSVSIVEAASNQCKGRFPFLTGAGAEETLQRGTAVFDGLVIQCAPEGSITLSFEARLTDLLEISDGSLSSYFISNRTEMAFRSCRAGEFIKDGQCTTCPIGTFSLVPNVTVKTECRDGTTKNGIRTCYADQIIVKSGYWRRHRTTASVLACSNDLSSCSGGNGTGNSLCLVGHEGPLCAVCSDGYYRDGQLCTSCENKGDLRPVTAFYVAIAACGTVMLLFFFCSKYFDAPADNEPPYDQVDAAVDAGNTPYALESEHGSEASAADSQQPPKLSLQARMRAWLQASFESVKVKVKILITTYQIVSSIPTTTAVKFPTSFARFLNAFDVFNLNVVSTLPIGCTGNYTFIDKLVFTTLFPIALAVLLMLFFMCEVMMLISSKPATGGTSAADKLTPLKDKYLTYFFFLTYLVLPSVSTTIFQTFLCTNVDPSGEDSDASDYYLTADMSISCTSDYYHRGVAYAIAMLLIYVVGIPLMYFILLYSNRQELMTRPSAHNATVDAVEAAPTKSTSPPSSPGQVAASRPDTNGTDTGPETKALSARAARLSFLWDAYEPKFWYWEVVETTRRLMLTAVLSVCGAGTSSQAIFAILLALMYIKVYGYYKPYDEDKDDLLAETGQFQIFFSFLGALIYQKALLGSRWSIYVSIALISINLAVTLIFAYYELGGLLWQAVLSLLDYKDTDQPGKSDAPQDPPQDPPALPADPADTAGAANTAGAADVADVAVDVSTHSVDAFTAVNANENMAVSTRAVDANVVVPDTPVSHTQEAPAANSPTPSPVPTPATPSP